MEEVREGGRKGWREGGREGEAGGGREGGREGEAGGGREGEYMTCKLYTVLYTCILPVGHALY